jgi:putative transposase
VTEVTTLLRTCTLLRGPVEPKQYLSYDYAQVIDDHHVLASVGTVGDAYDNALAESFVDTFKTELLKDRVWKTRGQLELAVVEWVSWFNHDRLHESLSDIPPVEFEDTYLTNCSTTPPGSSQPDGSGSGTLTQDHKAGNLLTQLSVEPGPSQVVGRLACLSYPASRA